jgi:hypothetical protein
MKQLIPLVICIIIMAAVIGGLMSGTYSPDHISQAVASADEQMKQAAADYAAQVARDQIVVPAKAQADAASIAARTQQQISEEAHQQDLRHQGEMAALNVSNTLQLNKINVGYQAAIASIASQSAVEQANAAASVEERAALSRIVVVASVALAVFLIIIAIGLSSALNRRANNSARVKVLSDDGLNQVLMINGKIIYKTAQQLGEAATIQEPPALIERVVMLIAAASIAKKTGSLAPLAEVRAMSQITTTPSASATNSDLLKLANVATAGYVAAAAIHAQPAAAQHIARQSAQQAAAVLEPGDELPELIMLDNPAQRAHIEQVLEMSR